MAADGATEVQEPLHRTSAPLSDTVRPWRVAMGGRDPHEPHPMVTPLELLFESDARRPRLGGITVMKLGMNLADAH